MLALWVLLAAATAAAICSAEEIPDPYAAETTCSVDIIEAELPDIYHTCCDYGGVLGSVDPCKFNIMQRCTRRCSVLFLDFWNTRGCSVPR